MQAITTIEMNVPLSSDNSSKVKSSGGDFNPAAGGCDTAAKQQQFIDDVENSKHLHASKADGLHGYGAGEVSVNSAVLFANLVAPLHA